MCDHSEHSSAARVGAVERRVDEPSKRTDTVLARTESGAAAEMEAPERVISRVAFEIDTLFVVDEPVMRNGVA
jgi:hypothetical protein